jgi:hypothetical protein
MYLEGGGAQGFPSLEVDFPSLELLKIIENNFQVLISPLLNNYIVYVAIDNHNIIAIC